MNQAQTNTQTEDSNTAKWFNSPISFYEGTLLDIHQHIPEFERRTFAITQPKNERTRLNERLDMIVRKPTRDDPNYVPVGVVSKEYTLVPHLKVIKVAIDVICKAEIKPSDIEAQLEITEYGERMALSLFLPNEYSFTPYDGHKLALRLECFNSVEGSTRFRAVMGWFRFVCSNGLIIGVTQSDLKRRHTRDFHLTDLGKVLTSGITHAEKEKENFEKWHKYEIESDRFNSWILEDLKKIWGFKAAARTYHIAKTGHDVKIVGPYKDNTPISIPVEQTNKVPGTPKKSNNLYDISQILAWLAKERRDVQEQLEWRERIPELMKPFFNW